MQTRLHTVAPDLANSIKAISDEVSKSIAKKVSAWAAARVTPGICYSIQELELIKLVEDLDSIYFGIQEKADRGEASSNDVMEAFKNARVANAVLFGIQGNAVEAIYEALIATDDLGGVNALVHDLLA